MYDFEEETPEDPAPTRLLSIWRHALSLLIRQSGEPLPCPRKRRLVPQRARICLHEQGLQYYHQRRNSH
jgi:hypothetical protein